MGFGISVIQRLVKTSIKKNLYFEIKDRVFEDRYENGIKLPPSKQRVRVYGTNSDKAVRKRLIEILYERVDFHKDKFIAPILHKELETMEIKKSGKVEHADGCHDDQIFSYLMALRIWYDGENLVENFGLRKNTIKTDEDEDIENIDIESENYEKVSIDNTIYDEDFDEEKLKLEKSLDFVKDAARYKLAQQFITEQYLKDLEERKSLFSLDKDLMEAYEKKYNIDHDESNMGGNSYVTLPDSYFDMEEDEEDIYIKEQIKRNGNLFNMFNQL